MSDSASNAYEQCDKCGEFVRVGLRCINCWDETEDQRRRRVEVEKAERQANIERDDR